MLRRQGIDEHQPVMVGMGDCKVCVSLAALKQPLNRIFDLSAFGQFLGQTEKVRAT